MFEGQPDTRYGRFRQETEYFFKVPRWLEREYVRRMDPELAVDIPLMCVRHAGILQLTDTQQSDLHTLVASIPDTTDIRREIGFSDEPRLGIRRQYLRHNIETETRYAPVTPGLLGMRIRVRQFDKDGFDITALYMGGLPSADAVLDVYINLRMHNGSYPFRIDQLSGDHISFDLSERHRKDDVLGIRYRHLHLIGNFALINSAKDVFLPGNVAR